MKNKRIVIIDDEEDSREILRNYLKQEFHDFEIIAEADSIKSGVELLKDTEFDLLFLDIQFPGGTGFDILQKLGVINFKIIFVTAYDEFAIKAIKHNAFDYLLKPLDREELCAVVNRYVAQTDRENRNIPKTSFYVQSQLSLPTIRGFRVADLSTIVRLESDGNYTTIFLDNKEEIIVSKPIKEYENLLPKDRFCRVHNSHIINIGFLKEYVKGRGGEAILKDGSRISVSQNKKSELLKYYK